MPIYEYTCKACEKRFEQLVRSMSAAGDEPKVKCPECGSTRTARALSVFAAVSASAPGAYIPDRNDAPMCGRCGGAPGSCSMQ